MDKVDFKKTLDSYRATHGSFRRCVVPPLQYLMIDGHGDPNTDPTYTQALETLYPVAYKLKFQSKQRGRDYVVPPLEGLWWAADMDTFTVRRDKSMWDWTMMLMVPHWLDAEDVQEALHAAQAKAPLPAGQLLRLQTLQEGDCVQTLHVGSYDDEAPVVARMHEQFIAGQGLEPRGKHHEIYLSDPRRVAPEKLKTILRQPVAVSGS